MMSGTEKKHRIRDRIIALAILLSVICGMELVAQQCFDGVHMGNYFNYDIQKIEASGRKVGMIVAGASHVYHACDVDILADAFGYEEVIDASSASMTNDAVYFLLKDLLQRFDPEYVLVDIPWDRLIPKGEIASERGRLLTMDRLLWRDKLAFAAECLAPKDWLNLSAMYRFGGEVWGFSQLKSNFRRRKLVAEGAGYKEPHQEYYKNGYCRFERTLEQGSIRAEQNYFSEDQVGEHELEYIRKTWELCEAEGVKLIWFTVPTSIEELYSVGNLDECLAYTQDFLDESGCPYLNFNYVHGREELFPDTVFEDPHHLSVAGAETLSRLLVDTIRRMERGEDVSDQFCASFPELQSEVHRIVGCAADVTGLEDGRILVTARSLQNPDIIPEYRLMAVLADGSFRELFPWQEGCEFYVDQASMEGAASFRLEARRRGEESFDAWQQGFTYG